MRGTDKFPPRVTLHSTQDSLKRCTLHDPNVKSIENMHSRSQKFTKFSTLSNVRNSLRKKFVQAEA